MSPRMSPTVLQIPARTARSGTLSIPPLGAARIALRWILFNLASGRRRERYLELRAALALMISRAGLHERANFVALRRLVRRGGIVVDVGAGVGAYTVRLAELVGPAGRVYAFEPHPESRRFLERIVDARINVSVLPYALWDRNEGQVPLRVPILAVRYPEPDFASLSVVNQPHEIAMVECRRLDECVPRSMAVSFVKVDVEGEELRFCQGAEETLERWRPVVQFGTFSRTQMAQAARWMQRFGYRMACLNRRAELVPFDYTSQVFDRNIYLLPR